MKLVRRDVRRNLKPSRVNISGILPLPEKEKSYSKEAQASKSTGD